MNDTNSYKELLMNEVKLLEEELNDLGLKVEKENDGWETTPEKLDTDSSQEDEMADAFESFEERNAVKSKLEERLEEVHHALERIGKGTYGMCKICKNPIEDARLKANPAADTCVSHKN